MSLAVVVAGSDAASALVAQPPSTSPKPQPKEHAETAESRAQQDLEKLGPKQTRQQAEKLLVDAIRNLDDEDGYPLEVPCDDPRVDDLEYAIRYFARAHDVKMDLDGLDTMFLELGRQLAAGGATADQARDAFNKRYGNYAGSWVNGFHMLRRLRKLPCPEPSRSVGATGGRTDGQGRGKTAYILGGAAGAALVGALVLSGDSSDGSTTMAADFSRFHRSFDGTMNVTGGTGCVQRVSVPVPITTSGNPRDGSDFTMDKGGLIFRGMISAAGAFQVEYVGPLSGFPGLPNNSTVRWRVAGAIQGNQLNGNGELNVTSGICNGNVLQVAVVGTGR